MLSSNFSQASTTDFILLKKLPSLEKALKLYFGNRYYKNMNRLFRGVSQSEEKEYTWIEPVWGRENLLANFLCGSLVNYAAAILPRLLQSLEEKKLLERLLTETGKDINEYKRNLSLYLDWLETCADEGKIISKEHEVLKGLYNSLSTIYPEFSLIDRGEKFIEKGKDISNVITKRRQTNAVAAPSVMSFSVFKEGSSCFHNDGTMRTKLEGIPHDVVVVNPGEGETLIPLGTTLKYTLDPTNEYQFFAREVRSPALVSLVSYWCSCALAEAYERYLSKPYSNSSEQVKINGKTIYRPNHGLAHTYRVMNYIPIIVNYFAYHGKDEEFRFFCQKMTKRQQEWLMVAAAFSVTGRQNEKSASEDREGYDSFRADCEGHLEQFLQAHPPEVLDDKMKKSILHIVRYMGNPGYEANWSELEKNESKVMQSNKETIVILCIVF